ncbi:MAG TPA: hypothetical protein VMV74_04950 [Bacteroidales bacterium]|nr:hypothetical protein [Bacteroidales bacterium]
MDKKSIKDISYILKQSYFWDIDITSGKVISKRLVIERIFNFGTIAEIAFVIRYYGKEEVEKILLNLNFIDPKTLNFVSKYFNRSKKEFRCFTRRQLIPQHWDY